MKGYLNLIKEKNNYHSSNSGGPGGGAMRMLSSTALNPKLLLIAFLVSIIIGMVAGVIPAYRASKLKPVDALRYE